MKLNPQDQIRCSLCNALFLIADDHYRLTEQQATQLRMTKDDPVCFSCWITDILMREDGSPHMTIGHA